MNLTEEQVIYMQAGKKSLQGISSKDISMIKSFKAPPPVIHRVFQLVQIVLAGKYEQIEVIPGTVLPKSAQWGAILKMLRNPNVFLELCFQSFDSINNPQINKKIETIKGVIKSQHLIGEDIKKVSVGAYYFFIWIQNFIKFWSIQQQK